MENSVEIEEAIETLREAKRQYNKAEEEIRAARVKFDASIAAYDLALDNLRAAKGLPPAAPRSPGRVGTF